jgi:hypothetical protein
MIGDVLTILAGVLTSSDLAKEVWLTRIDPDGTPHLGIRAAIAASDPVAPDEWAIGPTGTAFGTVHAVIDPSSLAKSELLAVSFDGIPAGFPLTITGSASRPAFDAAGRVHVVVGSTREPPARTLVFESGGQVAVGGSGALDVVAAAECVGVEGTCVVPAPPLVGADATRFVDGTGFSDTTVMAIGPSGRPLGESWPYRSDAGHQQVGVCPPGDVCEGYRVATPALGPGNVLHLLHSASSPSGGGSIVAIASDGRVRAGWPVALKRAGAAFWSVSVGSDGTAFALAIEPETSGSSATILAIGPDSTVRYATTIVEP